MPTACRDLATFSGARGLTDEHRRGAHEAAAGVSVDPQPLQIDERMAVAKLLKHGLLVRQAVVAEIAVSVAARTELSVQ